MKQSRARIPLIKSEYIRISVKQEEEEKKEDGKVRLEKKEEEGKVRQEEEGRSCQILLLLLLL